MNGKTVVVTGAAGGIGSALTERLAARGYRVIMACRNLEKARSVAENTIRTTGNRQIEICELDLASFSSIRRFADTVAVEADRPFVLVNNAGIMCKDFGCTADGFETTIGVNYIGTVLLVRLLLPRMKSGSSIVNTISVTRKIGKIEADIFEANRSAYGRFKAYANSKLALSLFTATLSEKLQNRGIAVNGADPGVVDTNMISMQRWFDPLTDLLFRPFIKSPQQGAFPAFSAVEATGKSGYLFCGRKASPLPVAITRHPERKRLWMFTEQVLQTAGFPPFDTPPTVE